MTQLDLFAASANPTEQERLNRIAQHHGINADALTELIDDARAEARQRRRRLPDLRLAQHVAAIGELGDRPERGDRT